MSAAARALHISQPALSRSVQRLEADLGTPLFSRVGRRVALNDAGRTAVDWARQILRDERLMRDAIDSVALRARALRVGTVAPAPLWRLTGLMVEAFPRETLTSEIKDEEAVVRGVLDGTFDLGIVCEPPTNPLLRSCELMCESLAVTLPPNHPLASRASIPLSELDGSTFLILTGIGFWRSLVERALPHATFIGQDDRMVFVGMDEAGAGALQGWVLADYFWETDHGTDLRYLLFQGVPDQENTDARSAGALQSLLDDGFFPVAAADYQVCGFDRQRAADAMTDLLAQGVTYDCVICGNDEMALGVIGALKAAGRDPGAVPIVSVDHTEAGADALEAGELYMTVDQNVGLQAKAAVAAAVNLDQGRPFDSGLADLLGETYTDPDQPYTLRVPVEAVLN